VKTPSAPQRSVAAAQRSVNDSDTLADQRMAGVDLNDVALFVRVVDLGSFARTARELRVPTSTVSRAVARLEENVGVTLLQRTPRSVRPTADGQAFYKHAAPGVAAVRVAAQAIESQAGSPRGLLRVTAPNDIGESFLAQVVADFAERQPRIEVELLLTTRVVNLVEEGVDLALRVGPLPDSSLVARKVGEARAALYAAPAYLAAHGTPQSLEALREHACVLFRTAPGETTWQLEGPGGEARQAVRGRIAADDYLFVRAAAVAGAGVALLPELLAAPSVASGALARVLPGHATAGAPLHLLHPAARVVPRKITAFRDFLIQACNLAGR
jgi:DNA-binding transcriptional LysR family regulator